MALFFKKLRDNGFKLYFAFCLLGFTLLIFLINVGGVFAFETAADPSAGPGKKIETTTTPGVLPRAFYRWNLTPTDDANLQETYVEFRGNKMLLKVRF